MATQIPVVLLGTPPNFTGIGELQGVDTLTGVFNHADLTSNSLAAKVGTTPSSLAIADNSLVGRVAGGTLGSLNTAQLSTLMETVLDRAGVGFTTTGQFITYQESVGFIAVAPGTNGEALVFNSSVVGGIESAPVASQLNGLADVTLTALTAGEVLRYSGTTFVNATLGVDDLTDVDIATAAPTDGQVLAWDNANSKFVPADQTGSGGSFSPSDLADISGSPIGNAQQLTLSSGSGVTEVGGELTLTSSTAQVTVDDGLKVNTLPAVTTPTNVVTSSSGAMSVSSIAELATQIGLDDLSSMNLTGLTSGQTITWDGTSWVPGSVASSLTGLSDVTITAPGVGQFVVHDGVDFKNTEVGLNTLSDVDTTGLTDGQVLQYNATSSNFEPTTFSGGFTPGSDFGGANLPNVGDITLDTGGTEHRIENDGSNNLKLTSASGTTIFAGAIEMTPLGNLTPAAVATIASGAITTSTPGQVLSQADLTDLSDVNIVSPNNGNTLIYQSGTWLAGTADGIGTITSDLDMQGNTLLDLPASVTTPGTAVTNVATRGSAQGQLDSVDLDALPVSAADETTAELMFKSTAGNLERLGLSSLPTHDDVTASAVARTAGQLWTASANNYLNLPQGTLISGQSSVAGGPSAAADTPQMKTMWAMNRYGDSLGMEVLPTSAARHTPTARVATANIPTEAFSDGLTVKCETSGTFTPGSANPGLTVGFVFGDSEVYTQGSHSESTTDLYPDATGLRGYTGTAQVLYTDETSGILASYLTLGTNALWHGYDAATGRGNELLWNCDATLTFEGGHSPTSRVRIRGELTYNRPLDGLTSSGSIVQGRRNVYDIRDDFPAGLPLSVVPEARASVMGQEYFPYAKLQEATGFTALDTKTGFTGANNDGADNLVYDRYKNYASLAFSAALSNNETVTINDGISPTVVLTAVGGTPSGTNEFAHGTTAAETAENLVSAINHRGLQVFAALARDGSDNTVLLDEVRIYPRVLELSLTDAAAPISCSNTTDCTVTGWVVAENIGASSLLNRMFDILPGIGEDWRRYWYPRVERIPFDFIKEVDTTGEGLSLALKVGGATSTNASDLDVATWVAGIRSEVGGSATKFSGAGFASVFPAGNNATPAELREHETYLATFDVAGTTTTTRVRYDGKQISQGTTDRDNYVFSYAPDLDIRLSSAAAFDGKTEGVLTASATSIVMETGQGTAFRASGHAIINSQEVISYTGVSGDTLTGVTRGLIGSTAVEHADNKTIVQVAIGTLKREVGSGGNVQAVGGGDADFVFTNFGKSNTASPVVFHGGKLWVSRVEGINFVDSAEPSVAENAPGTLDWRPLAADGADQMTVTSSFAWMIGGRVGQTD